MNIRSYYSSREIRPPERERRGFVRPVERYRVTALFILFIWKEDLGRRSWGWGRKTRTFGFRLSSNRLGEQFLMNFLFGSKVKGTWERLVRFDTMELDTVPHRGML